MAETTPNIGFSKPLVDEENWAVPLRGNYDLLDHILGITIPAGTDPNPSGQAIKGHKNQIILDANNVVWQCVITDLADPPTTPNMWVKLGSLVASSVVGQRNVWGIGQAQPWETVIPAAGVVTLDMEMGYIEFVASTDITIAPPVAGSNPGEYDAATMQDQGQIIIARVSHPAAYTISLDPGITYLGGSAALPVSPAGGISYYGFFKYPGGNLWHATAALGYN